MSTRREFITLLGGAAVWPLGAVAQVSTKRPLIAWLSLGGRTASWAFVEAFLRGMRDFGYTVAIAAMGPPAAFAAKAATPTIPIVFLVPEDPVRLGLVTSLARPGASLTGVNWFPAEVAAKRLELPVKREGGGK